MGLVSVLIWVEDARGTLAKSYVYQRVRSMCSINLELTRRRESYVCNRTYICANPVSLLSHIASLLWSTIGSFVSRKTSICDVWVSFDAHVISIHVGDLLPWNFWNIITDGMHEHCICALADVDLSKFGSASTNTAPLHSLKPCGYCLVSARTSSRFSGIYNLEVYNSALVVVR